MLDGKAPHLSAAASSVGRSFESDRAGVDRADSRHNPKEPESVPFPQHHAIQDGPAEFSFWPTATAELGCIETKFACGAGEAGFAVSRTINLAAPFGSSLSQCTLSSVSNIQKTDTTDINRIANVRAITAGERERLL